MISRIGERRSRLAKVSSRLAALSIPVLVIAAIGHRTGKIDAISTYAVIALGFSLAALAVVAALGAFAGIWRDGRKGAGAATRGLIVGLIVLILPAIGAWKVVTLPRLIDISTDPEDPPPFERAQFDRGPDSQPIVDPGEDEIAAQRDAYPDIVPRHYPVSTARVYDEAKAIVDGHRWRVLAAREPSDDRRDRAHRSGRHHADLRLPPGRFHPHRARRRRRACRHALRRAQRRARSRRRRRPYPRLLLRPR